MKIELKFKDTFKIVYDVLSGLVGGRYEVKPNIWVECPSDLTYRLRRDGTDIVVEFPKSKLKVTAAKWVFQLDGSISLIRIKKENILVQIDGMPDLTIVFI